MEHQVDNANRALTSFAKGRGFVIADATGTGKTYSGALIFDEMFDRGAQNILLVAPNDQLIGQWKEVLDPIGIKVQRVRTDFNPTKMTPKPRTVYVTTYATMGNWGLSKNPRRVFDLVAFDESHNLKNAYEGTVRAVNGVELQKYADNVLFLSATPIESVFHYNYMVDRLGVHDHFQHTLNELGIYKKTNKDTGESYWVGLTPQKMRDLNSKLVQEGAYVRHEMSFKSIYDKRNGELKHLYTSAIPVPMSAEGAKQYNALIRVTDAMMAQYPNMKRMLGGFKVNFGKAMLEQDKVPRRG